MTDKKTVETKRSRNSIRSRVLKATILSSLALGLMTLLVGSWLYALSLANRYISESFTLAGSTAAVLRSNVNVNYLVTQTMDIYKSLDDEQLQQTGSEEYRKRFERITHLLEYERIYASLSELKEASEANDLYLALFDEENDRLIYFCDPDPKPETAFYPGEWEYVENKEAVKFLHWDGQGRLYDISKTERYGWMCTSGVPIYNAKGEIICFVLADILLTSLLQGMINFLVQFSLTVLLVTAVISFIMSKRMEKLIVDPINSIASAAESYVYDKRRGSDARNHFPALKGKISDEMRNLNDTMAEMENGLSIYEENLTRITAENERISTELDLATRIQSDMLPNKFPPFPERKEFDIYASMDPAKKVGGDFYNYFLIDDDHLCLMIADVSGKGIPAALFMMASMIILSNSVNQGLSPSEVLKVTNDIITQSNKEKMFVTVWLGILEISSGKLKAANAGHEYPIIKEANGEFKMLKDKHGFVIGGMEGMEYSEYELQLNKGSKLFLYTDGLPEASDSLNNMFDDERILETLNSDKDASVEEMIVNMKKAVEDFVGEAEQFDDLTMLTFEYKGLS